MLALRSDWQKGYYAIAFTLAAIIILIGVLFVRVQSFLAGLTMADAMVVVSPAVPMAFKICDIIAYVAATMNNGS
jgi:hypothetical protein